MAKRRMLVEIFAVWTDGVDKDVKSSSLRESLVVMRNWMRQSQSSEPQIEPTYLYTPVHLLSYLVTPGVLS